MDAAALDKQFAALRADDAVLAQRLSDLDGRLTAWFTAMKDGQQAVVRLMRQVAARPAEPEPVAAAEAEPPEPTAEVARSADEPVLAAGPETVAVAEPEPTVVAEPAAELAADSAAEPAAPAQPEAEQHVPLFAGGSARRGAKRGEPAGPAHGDTTLSPEDEALLATLDDATAKAIRVKRRLTGGRKSVRQLLAEMGAAPLDEDQDSPDADKGKRTKKWWRRGDG